MFELNQKLSRRIRSADTLFGARSADFSPQERASAQRAAEFSDALVGSTFLRDKSRTPQNIYAALAVLVMLLLCLAAPVSAQLSGIYHEIYTPIGGSSLSRFTNSSIFPC